MFNSDIRRHFIISTISSLLRGLWLRSIIRICGPHITCMNPFWLFILLLVFCFFESLFVWLDFFDVLTLAEFALDIELFIAQINHLFEVFGACIAVELTLGHSDLPRGIYDWCLLFFFNRWKSLAVWLLDLLRGFESSNAPRSVAILSFLFPLEQEWVYRLCSGPRRWHEALPLFCSIAQKWVAARWSRYLFRSSWYIRFTMLSLHVVSRALTTLSICGRLYIEVCWLSPWGC